MLDQQAASKLASAKTAKQASSAQNSVNKASAALQSALALVHSRFSTNTGRGTSRKMRYVSKEDWCCAAMMHGPSGICSR